MLVTVAAGCGDDGIELSVELRSDFLPGREFVAVEVSVDDGVPQATPATSLDDFVSGKRVGEFSGLTRGNRTVRVVLRAADGEVLATRVTRIPLSEDFGFRVVVTRGCLDPCDDDLERVGCLCVPPECVVDPDLCGDEVCEVDEDCPASGIDCVETLCAEGAACLMVPRDSRCGPMQTCSTTEGCVPVDPIDAGPPDTAPPPMCTSASQCPAPSSASTSSCAPATTDTCSGEGLEERILFTWDCVAGRCERTDTMTAVSCSYDPTGLQCGPHGCGLCSGLGVCTRNDGGRCYVSSELGTCVDLACCATCVSDGSCDPTGQTDAACGTQGTPCAACATSCAPALVGGICRP